MIDTIFEAWWDSHHTDQPEAVKCIASAAFEAGMVTADQLHRSISNYLELDMSRHRATIPRLE